MDTEGHDRLLEIKPEGANHDPATCEICVERVTASNTANPDGGNARVEPGGGSMSDKTYTEDQLRAEVDKATAEMRTRLEELEKNAQDSEVEAKLAEAKAEVQAELDEVRKQLDEKVIEAQQASEELTALKTFLDDAAAKAERDAEIAAKRDERKTAVGEVAKFPEDYVTANADRWASMDDAAFAQYLDDLKVVAAKQTGDTVPSTTALTAAREGGVTTTGKIGSAITGLRELRGTGVDPRTL